MASAAGIVGPSLEKILHAASGRKYSKLRQDGKVRLGGGGGGGWPGRCSGRFRAPASRGLACTIKCVS